MISLETIAYEVSYSLTHGFKDNAAVGMRNIRRSLSGYLDRYQGISEDTLMEIIKGACLRFGQERPNKLFVAYLTQYAATYYRQHGIRRTLPDTETKHLETISGAAYQHNGISAFNERDFSSTPEVLSINYVDKQQAKVRQSAQDALSDRFDGEGYNNALTGTKTDSEAYLEPEELPDGELRLDELETQTDDEISRMIDSILGF